MLTSIAEDRETADTVPQDKLMAYARAAVAAAAEKKRIQAEISWAELENAPEEGRRGPFTKLRTAEEVPLASEDKASPAERSHTESSAGR